MKTAISGFSRHFSGFSGFQDISGFSGHFRITEKFRSCGMPGQYRISTLTIRF